MRKSTLLSLTTLATANAHMQKRQTTTATLNAAAQSSQLSSAVSQLVSLYIPTALYPALSSAASAHTLSGDVPSLLASALTASIPPEWLTAIPTQYSSNIASLESKVSELKSVASVGSISGAARVTTMTGDSGVVVTITVLPATSGGTGSGSSTENISITVLSATGSGSSAGSITTLTGTNTAKTDGSGSTAVIASTSTSKTSSAFAMATEIPAAIMGVAGLLGLVAAL